MNVHRIITTIGVALLISGLANTNPLFSADTTTTQQRCLGYHFRAGDSLLYKVTSYDTVIVYGKPTFVRNREEFISIVCDFVDEQGRMYVRQTLEHITAKENAGKDSVTRSTSDWIGRTAMFIMDSTGRRTLSRQFDTSRIAMSVGGPFQPMLLPPLYDSLCHTPQYNKGWLIDRLDTLAENGYPHPLLKHFCSYIIKKEVDTLGLHCINVQYAQTGQGSVLSNNEAAQVYSRTVLNGSGSMYFLTKKMIPFIGTYENLNNLTIKTPTSPETTARSITHSEFMLVYPPMLRLTKKHILPTPIPNKKLKKKEK